MLLAMTQAASVLESLGRILFEAFGGDVPAEPLKLHQIAARAAVMYIAGVAIVRIGKSRLLARVTNLDVIVGFILGSLLSRGITGNASLSGTAVASAMIVFVHWLITAIACRSHWLGTLVKGHASVVVKDGEINERALQHSNISPHDLEEQLRMQGVQDVNEVHLAHKERNGEISVIRRKPSPRVIEVVVREGVQTVRIEIA